MAKIRSFKPIVDARSRILILGSMPGPEALRRKEYYGFPNNHFWKILFELLETRPTPHYREKIHLLRERRIALWDVIHSCTRSGASDSSIRSVRPNRLPQLIRRHGGIGAIFLNGRTAEKLYRKHFGDLLRIPAYYLPSTSPAHASLSYAKKIKAWRPITKYLANRNPWC